ncbi:hypothetical protein ACIQ8G_26445 [Streptomyces sp. NPDC094154]|uniref:hypothetical protein n=1 Tax=Streptomyces sp. NPDC094154 TaxID=3366059 RepID=UPI003827FF45
MTGIELVVGYLAAWAVRKGCRVAGRADQEVDQALDAGMDRLHEAVASKLGGDPALERMALEGQSGQDPSERTRQRVQLALEDATDDDPDFALALQAAVDRLEELKQQNGAVTATGDGTGAVGGNVSIRADHGSAAAWTMGNVSIGAPPDPQQPGLHQH